MFRRKMAKTPLTERNMRSNELLGLLHWEVCGPMMISTRGGFSYFVTFMDDHNRYDYVFLIRHKTCPWLFKESKNVAKNQTGKSIKHLRSDKGGEYLNLEFQGFLKKTVLFVIRHLRTHHITMACQRGGIEPYSIWFCLWWVKLISLNHFRVMFWKQLPWSLTMYRLNLLAPFLMKCGQIDGWTLIGLRHVDV